MAYSSKQAKDATRAQSLAVAFRDNTAQKTLAQIGQDPSNRPAIVAFQESAGIGVDGKVGPQTTEAYNYYLGIPFTAATASRQQVVAQQTGAFKPTAPANAPAKAAAAAATPALPATNALVGKFKGGNALPWVLGFLTISLGAGMAIYKASR